jgi:TRAP-type C4-dicarboxylate transport system permease small subunit
MLETITAGLLLAAVSGVGYLAYKHPAAYRKIYWPLTTLALIIFTIIGSWMIGLQQGYTQVIPLIEPSKLPQVQEAITRGMDRWWIVTAAYFGATLYLLLLSYLPTLLEQEKKENPEEPSPEKKDENV